MLTQGKDILRPVMRILAGVVDHDLALAMTSESRFVSLVQKGVVWQPVYD